MPFHLPFSFRKGGSKPVGNEHGYAMVGYFPNWSIYQKGYKPHHVPIEQLSHVLYAFANVNPDDGTVYLSDPWADEQIQYEGDDAHQGHALYGNLHQFLRFKKQHRHLKLLLSVGGWSYSANFRGMQSAEKRLNFAQSCVKILANYGLDGIDIDWEYPSTRVEAEAYVKLLDVVRKDLDMYGERTTPDAPHYLLTVAAPCSPQQYELLDLAGMDRFLDFWNLMAYDFSGSWDQVANHQANLYGGAISVSKAVDDYQRAGVPSNKLVLGIPLYGRGFDGTKGPGQPYQKVSDVEGGVFLYKALPLHGAEEQFSEREGASWSYNGHQFISYDSPQATKAKAAFIQQKQLRGAMFWEMSGDHPTSHERSLIRCMASELHTLDSSLNHTSYPESVFDNVRHS